MTTKPSAPVESLASSYVLPAPKRPSPDVIVVPPRAEVSIDRGAGSVRTLGDRFLALAECQQQFLAELRSRLEGLDAAIAEDSRAQLKGALREAVQVLDWCDSVQVDLQTDSRRAASGQEPLDLATLCRDVAVNAAEGAEVHVSGHAALPWWGEATVLAEVVRLGLALVAERTGGNGVRRIEVGATDGRPWIRIAGAGEPGDSVEVTSVRRFRQAVSRADIRVVPDMLGPGGAGFVLLLPTEDVAAHGPSDP